MIAVAHDQCALRCATFLAQEYPSAKHLARDAGCHPDTAADFMRLDDPRLPGPRIMVNLAAKFGNRFVQYIYGPATGWTGANDMRKEIEALRRQADDLAQRLDELRVDSHRPENGPSSGPTSPSSDGDASL